jgi:hypothetical protein
MLRRFFAFWYDFIVGDDWRVALAVVLALAATAIVNQLTGVGPWWIVVVAVIAVLPLSVYLAARGQPRNHRH